MCIKSTINTMNTRRRNISWTSDIDVIAENLAFERRCKRGVSELLERLVRAESKRKRGIGQYARRQLTTKENAQ